MQEDDTDKRLRDLQCEVNGEPRTPLPTRFLMTERPTLQVPLILDHTPILPLRQVLLYSHFAEG